MNDVVNKDPNQGRVAESIFAIIANIIFIVLLNKYYSYIPFLTSGFIAILWMFNLLISLTILAHLILLVIGTNFLRNLINLTLNVYGFVVFYTLYIIYPFDFSHTSYNYINMYFRFFLIIVLFGMGIAVIVNFITLIFKSSSNK